MTAPKRRSAGHVEQLHHALANLATRGQRTPCAERSGYLWLADDVEDRALAVNLCRSCPLIEPCGSAAEQVGERFGVWGGHDFTKPKRQDSDAA